MKNIPYYLNILVVMLILLTPKLFHNDYTCLLDYTMMLLVLLNLFIYRFRKSRFHKEYFILSVLQLLYCLCTVSSNSELNYQRSRISSIFSLDKIFSLEALNVLESISFFSFLIILIIEVWFIYKSVLNKIGNVP